MIPQDDASNFTAGDPELYDQGVSEGLAGGGDTMEEAQEPKAGAENGHAANGLDPAKVRQDITLRRAEWGATQERVRASALKRELAEQRRETADRLERIERMLAARQESSAEEEPVDPVEEIKRHVDARVEPLSKEVQAVRESREQARLKQEQIDEVAAEVREDQQELAADLCTKYGWAPSRGEAFMREALVFAQQTRMQEHVVEAEKQGRSLTDREAYELMSRDMATIYDGWKRGGVSLATAVLDYALAHGFKGAIPKATQTNGNGRAPVVQKVQRMAQQQTPDRGLGVSMGPSRGSTGGRVDVATLARGTQGGDLTHYRNLRDQYPSFDAFMKAVGKA